jgi:hypothetical protein
MYRDRLSVVLRQHSRFVLHALALGDRTATWLLITSRTRTRAPHCRWTMSSPANRCACR